MGVGKMTYSHFNHLAVRAAGHVTSFGSEKTDGTNLGSRCCLLGGGKRDISERWRVQKKTKKKSKKRNSPSPERATGEEERLPAALPVGSIVTNEAEIKHPHTQNGYI